MTSDNCCLNLLFNTSYGMASHVKCHIIRMSERYHYYNVIDTKDDNTPTIYIYPEQRNSMRLRVS